MASGTRHGLGDPRISWHVVLDVGLADPPGIGQLRSRLEGLASELRWPTPDRDSVVEGPHESWLRNLAQGVAGDQPLVVVRHAHGLVLRADHRWVDGIGMLTVLGRLLDARVVSSARGRTGVPVPFFRGVASRLVEIVLRPQAVVAASVVGSGGDREGDVLARLVVPGVVRTAELVVAGGRAVAMWNARQGARATRISVAVGVSMVGGERTEVADSSGFLRLREVERLQPADVRNALTEAHLQAGAGGSGKYGTVMAGAVRLATSAAAPRLGSTLLVSHLGGVTAPSAITELAFCPVSGGGSGLALGAACLAGSTVLTLRARAKQHTAEGLDELLRLVVDALAHESASPTSSIDRDGRARHESDTA